MRAFLIAILTVVIGGLLLKAGEVPLTRWLEGAPLRVSAVTGPYNEIDAVKDGDKIRNNILGFTAFATIEIENVRSETAKNIRFVWGDDSLGFHSVSIVGGLAHVQQQNWTKGRSAPILVGNLAPGERAEVRVALLTYSPVYTLEHAKVYSNLGISSLSVKGFDPDGSTPYADNLFLALWENITPLFLIISCALAVLCLVLVTEIERYAKLLLDDEGFYLDEAQRFRDNKKDFSVPFQKIGKMKLTE